MSQEDLKVLFPEETITLKQIKVVFKPCKTKLIRSFSGKLNEYFNILANSENNIEFINKLLEDNGSKAFNDIFYLINNCWVLTVEESKKIAENYEDINFDEKQNIQERKTLIIDELDYDETLFLVSEFIRLNRNFFKSLGKRIKNLVEEKLTSDNQATEKLSPT